MDLRSSAFAEGQRIPQKYTGEGDDVSPPLSWEDAPEDTASFALIVEDPDAPREDPWVHWLVWDIPADVTSLPENSDGLTEGKNDFGALGYGGPMPPEGHGKHHYHFKLFALDAPLGLDAGSDKAELLSAMEGRVLAEAERIGIYDR